MLTFERIATKSVVFQMLTGLSLQAFLDLLPAFHHATAHIEHQAEQRRKQPRQRQKGGGRKPLLRSDADRLLFILFYFKVYPLQAVSITGRMYQPIAGNNAQSPAIVHNLVCSFNASSPPHLTTHHTSYAQSPPSC